MFRNIGKISVLLVAVLTASALVSGQTPNGPLQEFKFSPSDNFEQSFTGGETVSFNANFSNPVGKDLPVIARLEVSGPNMTETGKEFDVKASIVSKGYSRQDSELSCSARKDSGAVIYNCLKVSDREILADSENQIYLQADSHPAISTGDYSLEFSVLSMIGVPRNSEEAFSFQELKEGVEVGNGGDKVIVQINSDREEVQNEGKIFTYERMGVSGPKDEFMNAVDVELDANRENYDGTLRMYYDQGDIASQNVDEDSLDLYRYNEDDSSWSEIDHEQDAEDNYIEANVPHFSVYAVYGDEEETQSTGGGGSIEISDSGNENQKEDERKVDANFTEEGSEGVEPENQPGQGGSEEDQQNQQTGQEASESDQGDPDQNPAGTPTAAFYQKPSGIAAIIGILLLIVAAGYYEARKRRLREVFENYF